MGSIFLFEWVELTAEAQVAGERHRRVAAEAEVARLKTLLLQQRGPDEDSA